MPKEHIQKIGGGDSFLEVLHILLLISPWSELITEICIFKCLEHGPAALQIWLSGEFISPKTCNEVT